jgi:hypothetical protein
MEGFIIQEVEQKIKQVINESQLNIGVIYLIIKNLYNEIENLYFQYLQQNQLNYQKQEEEENGYSINNSDNNT